MSKKKTFVRKPGGGRKLSPIADGLTPRRRKLAQRLRASVQRGDVAKLAIACKVATSTVYFWMTHGNIPAEHLPTIARVLNQPEFTL